jgi:Dolichyl-phosphate-mannose-protein mannosyltransferase
VRRLVAAGALLLFVLACASTSLFAGLYEDEGVTVQIAIGGLHPSLMESPEPVPVTWLYPGVDGSDPRPLREVLANLQMDSNPYPPAYYVVLNLWTSLFGGGRVAMRLLSVLFGVLTLLGLARLARRLVPHAGGEVAILLLAALSPWIATISCFARPYAMALALGTWSTVAAVAMADDPRRRLPPVAFTLLSLLGLYTLYHYGFVLVWQACFLLASLRTAAAGTRMPAARTVVLAGVVIVVGFLPWVPYLRAHLALADSMDSYYVGPPLEDAGSSLWRLLTSFLVGEVIGGAPRNWLDRGVAVLLVATAALLVFGGTQRRELQRAEPVANPPGARHPGEGVAAPPSPPKPVERAPEWRSRRWGNGGRGAGRRKPDAPDPIGRTLLLTAPLYPLAILAADLQHGFRTLMIPKTSFLLFPLLLLLLVRAWSAPRSAVARAACLLAALGLLGAATVLTGYATRSVLVDERRRVAEELSLVDAPNHVMLLDTGLRSHAIPLLMAMQDAGVRELRVAAAPPVALTEVLERTLVRTDVERITLVNLQVEFDPRKMWSAAELDAAAAQARAAGWRARRARPATLAQLSTQDTRVLRIIDPVR